MSGEAPAGTPFEAVEERASFDGGQALELHMREGYDHSDYSIATYMQRHLRHHSARLR